MIRNMKDLLNHVYDAEIKDYLTEAYRCYENQSYRACVIMSVIAGSFDLHKKVKALAQGDESFRNLDNSIEKLKTNLKPYERTLIERCATAEIGILNANEAKELLRCLDTRNDCAHPSDFVCTAEKALDVFASMIDIVASKPALFGYQHIKIVIEKMKEKTFFYSLNPQKAELLVVSELRKFHDKTIDLFIKSLRKTIIETQDDTQKENCVRFFAMTPSFLEGKFEDYLSEFIEKDVHEDLLLKILDCNISILDILGTQNVERLLLKLDRNLESKQDISCRNNWIQIVLSKRFQTDNDFRGKLIQCLTKFKKYSPELDSRWEILCYMLEDEKCSEKFRKEISNRLSTLEFELSQYKLTYLQQIIIDLDDDVIYKKWISKICTYLNYYDCYKANDAISALRSIGNYFWLGKVSDEQKLEIVEKILIEGTKSGNHSYSCSDLMWDLNKEYPELVQLFLLDLFSSGNIAKIKKFSAEPFRQILVNYICSSDEKCNIVEKIISLKQNGLSEMDAILSSVKQQTE